LYLVEEDADVVGVGVEDGFLNGSEGADVEGADDVDDVLAVLAVVDDVVVVG
jgi:hypothetical protein